MKLNIQHLLNTKNILKGSYETKTNFKRKPSTIKELIPSDEFVIEKMINIEKGLFYKFINNLLVDYDFIKENIDLMYCDDDDIWHVIGVTSDEFDIVILVQSEGFR